MASSVELYFPAAQSTQDVAALEEELYFPAVQEVQVDSLEAPREELNFPSEQSSHPPSSSPARYLPATQAKHDAPLVELLDVPGPQ
jgi:hypothetical protein